MSLTRYEDSIRKVGNIGNRHGWLIVWDQDGVPMWGLETYNGISKEEIPRGLYDALVAFDDECQRREKEKRDAGDEEDPVHHRHTVEYINDWRRGSRTDG